MGVGVKRCGFWIFSSWENIFPYAIYFLSSSWTIHFVTGCNTKKPQTDPVTIKETLFFSNFSSLNMKQNNSLCANIKKRVGWEKLKQFGQKWVSVKKCSEKNWKLWKHWWVSKNLRKKLKNYRKNRVVGVICWI